MVKEIQTASVSRRHEADLEMAELKVLHFSLWTDEKCSGGE